MELQSKKPKPKLTKELLNMRKVEQIHLRLKNYDEAIKQKKLADEKVKRKNKPYLLVDFPERAAGKLTCSSCAGCRRTPNTRSLSANMKRVAGASKTGL